MLKTGQKWQSCEPSISDFVNEAVQVFHELIGAKVEAIYLHGSLAMGCFYPPKSDVDMLVLVSESITLDENKAIHEALLSINDKRPITGSLELSVVKSSVAKDPKFPVQFELHFGENLENSIRDGSFDYTKTKNQIDSDLTAHFMVAKKRGVVLYGPPLELMLGDIPWQDYMVSVLDDLEWILDAENIIESPFYGILNSCRVLQMLQFGEGTVSSKEEAAVWALDNFPKTMTDVVKIALECYRSPSPVTPENRKRAGLHWEEKGLLDFRDYIQREVKLKKH